MKKKLIAALVIAMSLSIFAGCGGESDDDISPVTTLNPEPISEESPTTAPEPETTPESSETPEENHDGMYRSEITNEWIDESLKDQRPIAVLVDNEKIALPHYGLTEADVVYEIMNSTANGRITRFMAIVKDWGNITQFGSIRSARPTNFMLAPEWNAVLIHDGGPFYIDDWVKKSYSANLSGGFARYENGKKTEYTEYVTYDSYTNTTKNKTYDGLKQRFEKSKYTTTYNDYYEGPHFLFADAEIDFSGRSDAKEASRIELPFPHNKSTLKYNDETGTYDYSEYGANHLDPLHDDAQLTFKNVILQSTSFNQLDDGGYMIYNAIGSGDGYYITNGKAIAVSWTKATESGITHYYDKQTGNEIQINTGKTYISLVPSDSWSNLVME
ncbi:MAG: DUF3048 domain-containing protein [Roseburia sp.]|nr:DUF3048 domain-containing protein [Roseburia sp.]MCM1096684.1 DUF3048 domain-containing protein [Ruminococcus flavefaciens]